MRLLEEEHDDHNDSKPWGDVILASFLVQLVSFSGIILTVGVGCYSRRHRETSHRLWQVLHQLIIPSFAAGALLATVVFLLIPEALELLGGHHEVHEEEHVEGRRRLEDHSEEEDNENESAWKFGSAVLGGFLLPIVLGAIFPPPDIDQPCEECLRRELLDCEECLKKELAERGLDEPTEIPPPQDPEDVNNKSNSITDSGVTETLDEGCDTGECDHDSHAQPKDEEANTTTQLSVKETVLQDKHSETNYSLAASILLGDAFHNFTDGIFIGNAFLLCGRDVGYTLVATTIYHEIAQELADFCLLTHHCGLPTWKALLANFMSGFSVMLGGVLILALDLSDTGTGVLLSLSAGVYLQIAGSECVPRVQQRRKNALHTLYFVICFVCGAVPIGLVLLNHGHCEADEHHDER